MDLKIQIPDTARRRKARARRKITSDRLRKMLLDYKKRTRNSKNELLLLRTELTRYQQELTRQELFTPAEAIDSISTPKPNSKWRKKERKSPMEAAASNLRAVASALFSARSQESDSFSFSETRSTRGHRAAREKDAGSDIGSESDRSPNRSPFISKLSKSSKSPTKQGIQKSSTLRGRKSPSLRKAKLRKRLQVYTNPNSGGFSATAPVRRGRRGGGLGSTKGGLLSTSHSMSTQFEDSGELSDSGNWNFSQTFSSAASMMNSSMMSSGSDNDSDMVTGRNSLGKRSSPTTLSGTARWAAPANHGRLLPSLDLENLSDKKNTKKPRGVGRMTISQIGTFLRAEQIRAKKRKKRLVYMFRERRKVEAERKALEESRSFKYQQDLKKQTQEVKRRLRVLAKLAFEYIPDCRLIASARIAKPEEGAEARGLKPIIPGVEDRKAAPADSSRMPRSALGSSQSQPLAKPTRGRFGAARNGEEEGGDAKDSATPDANGEEGRKSEANERTMNNEKKGDTAVVAAAEGESSEVAAARESNLKRGEERKGRGGRDSDRKAGKKRSLSPISSKVESILQAEEEMLRLNVELEEILMESSRLQKILTLGLPSERLNIDKEFERTQGELQREKEMLTEQLISLTQLNRLNPDLFDSRILRKLLEMKKGIKVTKQRNTLELTRLKTRIKALEGYNQKKEEKVQLYSNWALRVGEALGKVRQERNLPSDGSGDMKYQLGQIGPCEAVVELEKKRDSIVEDIESYTEALKEKHNLLPEDNKKLNSLVTQIYKKVLKVENCARRVPYREMRSRLSRAKLVFDEENESL